MTPPEPQLFRSLPDARLSPRALAVSVSLHFIILTLVICVPLIFVQELSYYTIVDSKAPLLKPPLLLPELARRSPARPKPMVIYAPLVFSEPIVPQPRTEPKVSKKSEAPPPATKIAEAGPQAPKIAQVPTPVPAPLPKLGGFSESAPAENVSRKPRELQAGGFGIPDDTTREKSRRDGATVQGAFDATADTGSASAGSRKNRGTIAGTDFGNADSGSGSGGLRKNRGTIAGTDFGNNAATAGANGSSGAGNSRGSVRQGEFGDSLPVANVSQPRTQPAKPTLVAVEILSKPKPAYSTEARDLRLEGEVVLEVLFTASGDIRILRLIRGLGHGLDDAAVKAAEQIRFKPAESDGKPIDSQSVVQIIFRLTGG